MKFAFKDVKSLATYCPFASDLLSKAILAKPHKY
nr:MAG TPA: hypothetical protein [Bacteriophage sp.]